MDRKIVFFDIDGTLYLYGKSVPSDTKEAIRKLRENGHLAVLCTGRTKSMVFQEIYDVGFDGMIAGGGTYVEFGGKVLHRFELPSEEIDEILKVMKQSKIMAIPEGIEYLYFDVDMMPKEYEPLYQLYVREVGEHVKDINQLSDGEKIVVSKVSGKVWEDGDESVLYQTFRERFHIVEHRKKYLEMIPKDYSKAEGIKRLIQELGISRENTYAFGDSMNDYEMLKYVEYGVAMGNADEEFKKQMKYVTEDYDKGGIYNALVRFGLIGK
ncbi:MAG: Cof-type HAD-IIB family hydrolase [Lachnospiraceae bacterium]|nr:Cof-type HAD-IIB family hydrolase [Lachnospiraceae bacterium]